jgi:hypothetical protein
MKPTSPTVPQFIDEQDDVSVSLPAFVTRTTLQSILQANGVDALTELGARKPTPAAAKSESTGTNKTEQRLPKSKTIEL